jgi:hypothetical protein
MRAWGRKCVNGKMGRYSLQKEQSADGAINASPMREGGCRQGNSRGRTSIYPVFPPTRGAAGPAPESCGCDANAGLDTISRYREESGRRRLYGAASVKRNAQVSAGWAASGNAQRMGPLGKEVWAGRKVQVSRDGAEIALRATRHHLRVPGSMAGMTAEDAGRAKEIDCYA